MSSKVGDRKSKKTVDKTADRKPKTSKPTETKTEDRGLRYE